VGYGGYFKSRRIVISEQAVLLSVDAGIATITMNRPQAFNSMNQELLSRMLTAVLAAGDDPNVRVVVIRGNGTAFCGGGDLKSMCDDIDRIESAVGFFIDTANALVLAIRRLRVPVICSVHGAAAGGGFSLAIGGDFVVAAQSARFVIAYSKIAVSPDAGLSHFLTERLGSWRAMDALLLRTHFTAAEMQELGIVNRIAPDDQLAAATAELAEQISQLPPAMCSEVKRLVNDLADGELGQQMSRERSAFVRCTASGEFKQRLNAFINKQR
jgi:2-(1,2-epoxy-1,2-dihydrophenyl)acetyl-CoA isomerase